MSPNEAGSGSAGRDQFVIAFNAFGVMPRVSSGLDQHARVARTRMLGVRLALTR
jgi:hypothetical protein